MDPPATERLVDDAASAAHLFAGLARCREEIAAVAYLDPKWRLLGLIHFAGTRDRVAPPVRAIVRGALAFDAVAVILAHGHPQGDATPSAADLAFTRRLAAALRAIEVTLVDHLIVTADASVGLRGRGLL